MGGGTAAEHSLSPSLRVQAKGCIFSFIRLGVHGMKTIAVGFTFATQDLCQLLLQVQIGKPAGLHPQPRPMQCMSHEEAPSPSLSFLPVPLCCWTQKFGVYSGSPKCYICIHMYSFIINIFKVCVHARACASMVRMSAGAQGDKRHWIHSEAGVTGGYKLTSVGAGSQTQILFQLSMCSYLPRYLCFNSMHTVKKNSILISVNKNTLKL